MRNGLSSLRTVVIAASLLTLASCGADEPVPECDEPSDVTTGFVTEPTIYADAPAKLEMRGEVLELAPEDEYTKFGKWVYHGQVSINGFVFDLFIDEEQKAYAIGCLGVQDEVLVWYEGVPCETPPPA